MIRYPRGSYTIIGNHVLERVICAAPAEAAVELALEARRFYRNSGLTKPQLQVLTGRGETAVRMALQRLVVEGRICADGDRYYIAPQTAQESADEPVKRRVGDDVDVNPNKSGKLRKGISDELSIQTVLEAAWAGVSDVE